MSEFSRLDYQYMARAIQLAQQGLYTTDPNPRVGCVLVREGAVIGEGYHVRAGEGHAEVNALRQAGDARGATAYVTLEPCSHFGRTPPCAQGLIDAGVSRVVAAMVDPNPEVAGRGLAMLNAAGIATHSGLLESEARKLNPGFLSRMERKRPFVRLKLAMSADGRTAMASGESQWITSSAARADVQQLRARSSAILTGIGSVLQDDSSLTVRPEQLPESLQALAEPRQPLRVVLDSQLRIPLTAKMLALPGKTLVVSSIQDAGKAAALSAAGAEHCVLPDSSGQRIDLLQLLEHLAQQYQVNELLVECGAQLAGSFIQQRLVDQLWVYMAPKLMGDQARGLAALPFARMDEAVDLKLQDLRHFGQDIRFIWSF